MGFKVRLCPVTGCMCLMASGTRLGLSQEGLCPPWWAASAAPQDPRPPPGSGCRLATPRGGTRLPRGRGSCSGAWGKSKEMGGLWEGGTSSEFICRVPGDAAEQEEELGGLAGGGRWEACTVPGEFCKSSVVLRITWLENVTPCYTDLDGIKLKD